MNEETTKLKYITPSIINAGWDINDIKMEYNTTVGRADYVLFVNNNPIAVVEAKSYNHKITDGLSQAIDYAIDIGCKFCFTSNGQEFLQYNLINKKYEIINLNMFPKPTELEILNNQYKYNINYKNLSFDENNMFNVDNNYIMNNLNSIDTYIKHKNIIYNKFWKIIDDLFFDLDNEIDDNFNEFKDFDILYIKNIFSQLKYIDTTINLIPEIIHFLDTNQELENKIYLFLEKNANTIYNDILNEKYKEMQFLEYNFNDLFFNMLEVLNCKSNNEFYKNNNFGISLLNLPKPHNNFDLEIDVSHLNNNLKRENINYIEFIKKDNNIFFKELIIINNLHINYLNFILDKKHSISFLSKEIDKTFFNFNYLKNRIFKYLNDIYETYVEYSTSFLDFLKRNINSPYYYFLDNSYKIFQKNIYCLNKQILFVLFYYLNLLDNKNLLFKSHYLEEGFKFLNLDINDFIVSENPLKYKDTCFIKTKLTFK